MNHCAAAKRIANELHARHLSTLRGVTVLTEAAAVVFGNDDYAHDPQTREEVRLLFEGAAQDKVEILDFATDDVGHSSWAVVLKSTDVEWLRAKLREATLAARNNHVAIAESNGSPGTTPDEAAKEQLGTIV
jgi:hypothetical protein